MSELGKGIRGKNKETGVRKKRRRRKKDIKNFVSEREGRGK